MTKPWLPILFLVACGDGGSSGPACGDGVLDPGEDCDDGNNVDGDGCTATCAIDLSSCGDGVLDPNEQCDDGNNLGNDGCSANCTTEALAVIASSWTFRDLANNQTTGCPNGFDTAAVTATPQAGGTPIIDLFNCSDGTGSADYPPDRYDVELSITNNGGTSTYATSLSEVIDVTASDGTFEPTIFNDAGYFELTWELRGAVSNNLLTCAQAGAQDISIDATVTGGVTLSSDQLDCNSGGSTGITTAFLADSYTVSISATDSNNAALGTPVTQINKVIMAPNKVTQLGTIVIPIAGQ